MQPARSDVGHLDRHVAEQVMLHGEVPLLVVGSLEILVHGDQQRELGVVGIDRRESLVDDGRRA